MQREHKVAVYPGRVPAPQPGAGHDRIPDRGRDAAGGGGHLCPAAVRPAPAVGTRPGTGGIRISIEGAANGIRGPQARKGEHEDAQQET